MRVRLTIPDVLVGRTVHAEGDVVDLADDVARRLFARGHAAPHVEAPAPPGPEAPADGPPAADPRPRKRKGS